MSEAVEKKIDILAETEPVEKEDPVKETSSETKEDPNQKELDWRSELPDDLKTSKSLDKFKTQEDLVKAYMNLEHKMGNKSIVEGIKQDASYEEKLDYSEKVWDIKEDSYKSTGLSETEAKYAWDNRVPPAQADAFLSDLRKEEQIAAEEKSIKKEKKYREEVEKLADSREVLNTRIEAGLNALNMTFDEYKRIFGSEHLNPAIVGPIAELGKKQYSEEVIKIKEGGTGGLPSDIAVLRVRMSNLVKAKIKAPQGSREAMNIQQELDKVAAKMTEINKKTNETFI